MLSKVAPSSSPSSDLIRRSILVPLSTVTLCYLTFFLALLIPFFQRHFIFLHSIAFPLFPTYNQPQRYGLAPHKTRNLQLATSDGEKIGAWHVLPEIYYQSELPANQDEEKWGDDVYSRALREYPTILYLHGNSMNRAAPWRISAYQGMTSRVDANVIAIDYRGFGDSSGTPSEPGLVEDAQTAYDFVREQQGTAKQPVIVFGQSLGTGITALLAAALESRSSPADGIVLMAPYTDLKSLVKDFKVGGLLPVLKPIGLIPFNSVILDTFLKTHLNTNDTLPQLEKTPVVLLHAKDDPVIPLYHSHKLFENIRSHRKHKEILERRVNDYASIKKLPSNKAAEVTLIETDTGGHNQLTEGALDLVRLALKLPSHLSLS
ncbi:hypothetical protein NDA18_003024 [Ustilago nuda]|nr:hypothetical protein NDA18_003024 [Ustilago nuda]